MQSLEPKIERECVTLVRDEKVAAIVRRCYSDVEVRNRLGEVGRGYTNLKRIFGTGYAHVG